MSVDLGVLLGGVGVLVLAARRGWLTASGVAAATIVGAGVWWGTGPGGFALLLLFFATSSLLTGPGGGDAGGRDAGQVTANGGVAALAGAAGGMGLVAGADLALAGALAAATADTWASEVGRRWGRRTFHVLSRRSVAPGSPAGISVPGSCAALAGACLVAGVAAVLGVVPAGPGSAAAVGIGGVAGSASDSLLGATLEVRWAGFDNDAVNAAATLVGAATAWLPTVA